MHKSVSSFRWENILNSLGFGRGKKRRKSVAPHHRGRRFFVEPLEDRTLLSVCVWTGGGGAAPDNNWNNEDNWVLEGQPSQHVVPAAGDELHFDDAAQTSTYNDLPAGMLFTKIRFKADDFTLDGHTVTLTNGIEVDAGITDATISLNIALGYFLTVDVPDGATLTISGALSGTNYLDKTGAGTLALGGANSYTGGTTIYDGTLLVDDANALVNTANGGLLLAGQNAVLDLHGNNISVGTVGLINGRIFNSDSTTATLTATTYVVHNGRIEVPLGDNAAPLIKCTGGSVTITGGCNYTGPTTVYGGELTFDGPDAWDPILNDGGVNVQDGLLRLAYTIVDDNPSADVDALMKASYDGGAWDVGQFQSSTVAAAGLTLGWIDTGTAVNVQRAVVGDVPLDGAVNFDDLNLVLGNYGTPNATWGQGDVTYDGLIDFDDLNFVLGNYGSPPPSGLPPQVAAIAPLGSPDAYGNTVRFAVVFSEAVSGVDAGDFVLDCYNSDASGTIKPVVDSSLSPAVWLVTVENVSGNGQLGLNLVDDDTIVDSDIFPLVGDGIPDGSFTGDVCTVASAFVWDGGGSNNNWTTAANWAGDVAPQAGDSLCFAGSSRLATVNDFPAGTSFASIELASSGFSIAGENALIASVITVDTGVTDAVISANVAVGSSTQIKFGDSAVLTLDGDISGSGQIYVSNLFGEASILERYDHQDLLNLGGDNSGFGGQFRTIGGIRTRLTSTQAGSADATWWLSDSRDVLDSSVSGSTICLGWLIGCGTLQACDGADPVTFEIGRSGPAFSGSIIDGAGQVALTKTSDGTPTGGTLTLSGTNTYSGGTTIEAGTLQIGDGSRTGGSMSESENVINNGALVFNCADDVTFDGIISGDGSLTKLGRGILTLTGENTYTGGTTIGRGTIRATDIDASDNASNLGNSASAIVLGTTAEPFYKGILSYTGAGGACPRGFVVNAGGGEIDCDNGDGTLAITTGDVGIASGAGLTIGGPGDVSLSTDVSGDGSLSKIGSGTLTLSAAVAYGGGTTIKQGAVDVGSDGINLGTICVDGGELDLNGHSAIAGAVTLVAGKITNSGSTAALTAASCTVMSGSIDAILAGSGTLTKTTNGTVTLSGANTYTGTTTVAAGVLKLVGDARGPFLTGSNVADIQGGKMVFDYQGQSSPAATILSLLAASYNGGAWNVGQFRNSTAGAKGLTLGWLDDGSSAVSVMATLAGDLNLDAQVTGDEVTAVVNNQSPSGNWSTGDLDYDDEIDGSDVTLAQGNSGRDVFLGVQDSALANETRNRFADGSISREDMMAILLSVGDLSAAEFEGLQTIVASASVLGMTDHNEFVAVLAGYVVNGSSANPALAHLTVGSTSVDVENLVKKWFEGEDVPEIADAVFFPYTETEFSQYTETAGSLFRWVEGQECDPSYEDVVQGGIGTCYFNSTLGAIALANPDVIRNMFRDNGDGTWTVRFYADGVADYVTVNRQLPVDAQGRLICDGYGWDSQDSDNVLWLPLLEKAYAQWTETGKVAVTDNLTYATAMRDATNSYAVIAGGIPIDVFAQVVRARGVIISNGAVTQSPTTAEQQLTTLTEALEPGNAIAGLAGGHVYVLSDYDDSNGSFTLYDPYGFEEPGLTWFQLGARGMTFTVADASNSESFG